MERKKFYSDKNGVHRMYPKPRNHKRQIIIEENLLDYIDKIGFSERNKSIIIEYVSGVSQKKLAEQYKLNYRTIAMVVNNYVKKVHIYIRDNE